MLTKSTMLLFAALGIVSTARAQTPTISGLDGIWWLGSGNLSDHAYYAKSALTANPNGLSGTASWSVGTVPGGGSLTITCNVGSTDCLAATTTATAPSNGCVYDVSVTVTIGTHTSAPFSMAVNQPKNLTLVTGITNPEDTGVGIGFQTEYQWNITDLCGTATAGLDQGETFGSVTQVTTNNWNPPSPMGGYQSGSVFYDYMGAICDCYSPLPQNPSGGTTIIMYAPWSTYAGSQYSGGVTLYLEEVSGYSEYWVLYEDHGRHCTSGSGCS